MVTVSRRGFSVGAGALAVSTFAIGKARAAEFTYKYANNLPISHPMNVRAQEAAAKIKEETGGRFELQVYPSSQLGSDTDTLGQIRSGAVDFFTLSGLILSTFVPAASINGVGFAFKDYDTVWKAMDGKLGEYVRAEIAKSRSIFAFDKIWDNGFRQITSSNKPIATPADLVNFKIRVPPSPLWTSMFKAFGSAPTSINFNEVYSALQSKVVDGQENPLAIVSTAKLYEVQSYCSLTNHMWDGFWFLANRRNWEALPENIRQVVTKNINAAAVAERADVVKLNDTVQADLTAKGMKFNTVDPTPFRDKLKSAGFYSEWKGKYGDTAWTMLEAAAGSLG
ncbi:MAG: TRAP transporter substrate-binding protein [Reyranella sp.]|uniref:TRAP transporter substrate-binding protein n=1 Tax=Reyranella sp. TaxID=1929291 RepID=UPI0009661342|nr:TRAP transporter substrate-binding protein [Reyranella sp.]MBN9541647.1 TRAP transporter substrate-binding protein [Alphaproteobacteria bacterium]MBR2815541.1 TRAP transporter substrate-binding protein [Reyranella sp.]OJU44949.1 MAG: ABC transporter substrate-binding protein [Alphaproteobacteria bacterium 65-37]